MSTIETVGAFFAVSVICFLLGVAFEREMYVRWAKRQGRR